MGYLARGPPFFAWIVYETKEEANSSVENRAGIYLPWNHSRAELYVLAGETSLFVDEDQNNINNLSEAQS